MFDWPARMKTLIGPFLACPAHAGPARTNIAIAEKYCRTDGKCSRESHWEFSWARGCCGSLAVKERLRGSLSKRFLLWRSIGPNASRCWPGLHLPRLRDKILQGAVAADGAGGALLEDGHFSLAGRILGRVLAKRLENSRSLCENGRTWTTDGNFMEGFRLPQCKGQNDMNAMVSFSVPRFGLFLTVLAAFSSSAWAEPPGGIQLLPGYEHKTLRGIDSRPGVIEKEGGLKIYYDIGRITQPGEARFGGDFHDAAERFGHDKTSALWYKEQVVNGQPAHIAYGKDHLLHVSFPQGGINFSTKAETVEDVTEALLMLLTYRVAKP